MTMVMPPMTEMKLKCWPNALIDSPLWNTGYRRATRNTPPTTIVDECSSDDTGVGPAMASGSQVCSGNWPLLPMQAMNKAMLAISSTVWLVEPSRALRLISWMENVPMLPNRMAVPTSRPTSPTRTVKNALRAARLLASSSHQWPMSMNEQRPMISQPRISWTMFSARTITSIPALNSVRAAKKWVYRRSPRTYSSE